MKYYIITIMLAGSLYACTEGNSAGRKVPEVKRPHFDTASVIAAGISTSIKLPAQLASYQEVSIFPKVNGYVKKVLVDIGSQVHKGQLLMMLEDPELEQATVQAREKVAHAVADYTITKDNYYRLLEASQTAGAVSPMDLSAARSRMAADSALCNAEKANWEMEKALLAYLEVTAPFDGVITERNVHPGALVNATGNAQKPMLELKQLDRLRLQVDVPENVAAGLDNKTKMDFYVSALPGKKMSAPIARKSDNVNLSYRMERVEMDVWNKDGILAPGMYADVVLDIGSSREAFSVPRSAVITSTERKYVILVRDGKLVKEDVLTGNASDERIEVFGNLKKGDIAIVNANDEIKEGQEFSR